MAVTIRLRRMGKKKQPFYRIVVQDSRRAPNGPVIEEVGTYDPRTNPAAVNMKKERVKEWIAKGAQPSDTVRSLLKKAS